MRFNPISLLTAMLLMALSATAQNNSRYDLMLNSGIINPEKNITAEGLNQLHRSAVKIDGKAFVIIQFEKIPTEKEKEQLKQSGIELLDYIPNNAYTAIINGSPDLAILQQINARSIIELTAIQKMQPDLAKGNFPSWAVKVAGTVDVLISFPKAFSFETVKNELRSRNFDIISTDYKEYRIVALRVGVQRLGELALLPFIEYVQALPGDPADPQRRGAT